MKTITLFLLALIVLVVVLEFTEGRRGRFSSRSRSYRSYRSYRSSVRYSRTRISSGRKSFRSVYGGYRLGGKPGIRTAILAGTIYGATRWRRRRPKFSYSDDDLPEVCYNDRYSQNVYGNISYYGRFICPDDFQSSNTYCCGEEGKQECCGFWDDGGRVAGVVIGILVFLLVVCVIIYCCCCKNRRQPPKPVHHVHKEQTIPLTQQPAGGYYPTPTATAYPPTATPPTSTAYPPQPTAYPPPANGNVAMPPPPSYDSATSDGKLPYDLPAVSPPAYEGGYAKPSAPYEDSSGGLPYGLNPGQGPPAPYVEGGAPYPPASAPYSQGNPPYPPGPGGFYPPPPQ